MLLKSLNSLLLIAMFSTVSFSQTDDCASATTINPSTGCTSQTAFSVPGSFANGNSENASCDQGSSTRENGWFKFTATSTNTTISISNASKRVVLSAWTNCPLSGGSELACEDSQNQNGAMNYDEINEYVNISFATTIGTTYYIQVKRRGGSANKDMNGNICVYDTPSCLLDAGPGGNTEDYCSTAIPLIQGTGTFSGTTYGYTDDEPGNIASGVYCGGASLENLSWYTFTANSTTESFNFASVSNCTSSGGGVGIQASILEVSYDANGCCNSFTNFDCNSSINQGTSATLTASGLTIGNQYILAVDGNGGDECDYTISGWAPGVVLPVRLIKYSGIGFSDYNVLTWMTASEINNDYFIIEKSIDGINFENIGTVRGNGNSSTKMSYQFKDYVRTSNIEYYRLSQVDYNGVKMVLGTITLERDLDVISVFPNPSNGDLNINFGKKHYRNCTLEFIGVTGRIVTEKIEMTTSNTYKSTIFKELDNGLYYLLIKDSNDNVIESIKVIKK